MVSIDASHHEGVRADEGGPPVTGTGTAPSSTAAPKLAGQDLQVAVFAQSVELALVELYAAVQASGKLSNANREVCARFAEHHKDHAAQFGAFAGRAAVARPNKALLAELMANVTAAPDEHAILTLARGVEEELVSTHLAALGVVESLEAAGAVATILPIEAQHAVALSLAIDGRDPESAANAASTIPNFETGTEQLDAQKYGPP